MSTLTERIRGLENLSEDARGEAIRKEFGDTASRNSLARAVVSGETTFGEQYNELLGRYRSLNFFPRSAPANVDRIRLLERCLGDSGVTSESFLTKLENPVGMASALGVGGVVLSTFDRGNVRKRDVSRRAFLAAAAVFFGSVGFVGGTALSYATVQDLGQLEQNATYLDITLKRYPTSTENHAKRP